MSRSRRQSPLSPRRRPSRPRSAEIVAVLLEAAAQVLERDGLEGFNTNAVAHRAGVSIGSLYQYFPGKDALTLALMQREGERFHAEASEALDATTGLGALRALIDACVGQQLRRPVLARLLDTQQGRPDLKQAAGEPTHLQEVLRQILGRADLPEQSRPEVTVQDIFAVVRGVVDAGGEQGETDVADLTRRVEAAVFGYLDAMARGG